MSSCSIREVLKDKNGKQATVGYAPVGSAGVATSPIATGQVFNSSASDKTYNYGAGTGKSKKFYAMKEKN